MKRILATIGVIGALASAAPASAAIVVLNFEGLGELEQVGNFYNGGAGMNFGVSFQPGAQARIDADAPGPGAGNFANEPSESTIMFFPTASNAVMNYAAGFDTGFSFFYTSAVAATVRVFSGENLTGDLLGTVNLMAQHDDGCVGDPNGTFCNWTNVGVAFGGTARSVDFAGAAGFTGFDDITFGSATAGVPEPATWAMMLLGFGFAGGAMRYRRRSLSAPCLK